jgi:hypothetical protein
MRRYRKVGGTFLLLLFLFIHPYMWGLAPFVSYPFSNTQFRVWYYWVARPGVCVCVYQSWAISSRDSTSPSRRHTHTPNLARSQTGTRRFVGASHTHTHIHDDLAFFLSCLLFFFLSNGHHFLPVFHQNLFGAPNFIDAQGKLWPFLFFFFSGREHFLGIRREIQTGHRAAVLSGIAADQSVFRFSCFLPIGRI